MFVYRAFFILTKSANTHLQKFIDRTIDLRILTEEVFSNRQFNFCLLPSFIKFRIVEEIAYSPK